MTLSALLSAAYDECNYASSPASAVTTRITRFLNEGVRLIASEPGLLRQADSDAPYTFASVASTARYVVPEAVAIIERITERTNDQALAPMSLAEYRHIEPDPTATSGTPCRYVPIGRVAVATQPADASQIFVKSSAAGDTTQTAYIEGVRTGGYLGSASVVLTGATAVSLSASLTDFIEITDFYLSAVGVGTITLTEDSGAGATLATIAIGATRPRYFAFYLWPTPSAAITYYVDYRRELVDMSNSTDEPPFPTDLHPMLVAYAVMREAEKTHNDALYVKAGTRYTKFMNNLKYQTQVMADDIPVAGRGRWVGRSHYGAYYPADYWVRW